MPTITEGIGLGLAFVVGLLTSFHCVGMCGGFIVAYTTADDGPRRNPLRLHAWYALGKFISYGAIGAGFGFLGHSISVSHGIRVGVTMAAGLVLVLYGLTSLGLLPLQRWMGARTPTRVLRFFTGLRSRYQHPMIFGLFSGVMVMCGPLQAIYVAAAGTGSALQGAVLLLAFAAGTLPLLMGFGMATGFLSMRFTRRALQVASVAVIVLGALMINRGVAMSQGKATCCQKHEPPALVVPK